MSWAAVRVPSVHPTSSTDGWSPTRSSPWLPVVDTPACAPIRLLQVLVVVVGDRSCARELKPDATRVCLVSRPDLGVDIRPTIDRVPDIGLGTDPPEG